MLVLESSHLFTDHVLYGCDDSVQIGGDDEEEEDLVMIEARDKERDFMCPFTAMKIEIPMKK